MTLQYTSIYCISFYCGRAPTGATPTYASRNSSMHVQNGAVWAPSLGGHGAPDIIPMGLKVTPRDTGATLAVSVKARIRQVKADLKQAKVARAAAKASAIEAAAAAARREQLNDESNARISQMYVTVGSLLPPPNMDHRIMGDTRHRRPNAI